MDESKNHIGHTIMLSIVQKRQSVVETAIQKKVEN